MRKMKVSMFNRWADEEATVDIEDMPKPLAVQLVEALTLVKFIAGPDYPELAKFRTELVAALLKESP